MHNIEIRVHPFNHSGTLPMDRIRLKNELLNLGSQNGESHASAIKKEFELFHAQSKWKEDISWDCTILVERNNHTTDRLSLIVDTVAI
jgi:hypothetical protein